MGFNQACWEIGDSWDIPKLEMFGKQLTPLGYLTNLI